MTDTSDPHPGASTCLASDEEVLGMLEQLAQAIVDRHNACDCLALIGIQRRGVVLAQRLQEMITRKLGQEVLSGSLDITLYRDDWTTKGVKPCVGETRIRFDVADKVLILVDDVLYTGRTIRAALEALIDFGRPRKVELLALVDRGNRELPIHADYVGLDRSTSNREHVDVFVKEIDGREGIFLRTPE